MNHPAPPNTVPSPLRPFPSQIALPDTRSLLRSSYYALRTTRRYHDAVRDVRVYTGQAATQASGGSLQEHSGDEGRACAAAYGRHAVFHEVAGCGMQLLPCAE